MAIRTLAAPTRAMWTHSDDEMAIADNAFDAETLIKVDLDNSAKTRDKATLRTERAAVIEAATEAAAQRMSVDFSAANPSFTVEAAYGSFRRIAERRMTEMLDEATEANQR